MFHVHLIRSRRRAVVPLAGRVVIVEGSARARISCKKQVTNHSFYNLVRPPTRTGTILPATPNLQISVGGRPEFIEIKIET